MEAIPQPAPPLEFDLEAKYHSLLNYLAGLNSAITAFSGGVDSSLLSYLAYNVLGNKALAVTSCSESLSKEDLILTKRLAKKWGMPHRIIKTDEIENNDYQTNPVNRCYFCKSTLYKELIELANNGGYTEILNGTIIDDLNDHRPGLLAAQENGIDSPLANFGFTKSDIRSLAGHLKLENAEKPEAACLASRIPYGMSITGSMLNQIEEAEKLLKELGFKRLRVRHHDEIARIEVPTEEFLQIIAHKKEIEKGLRSLGYKFVTLDLRGYRSGSFNKLK